MAVVDRKETEATVMCGVCGSHVGSIELHEHWHRSRREASAPAFRLSDVVVVRDSGERGVVVDYWCEQRGRLHCYTIRMRDASRMRDFVQDELEPP